MATSTTFRKIFVTETVRPNRLRDAKNEEYHRKYARWALGAVNHSIHTWYLTKALVNWNFYKGNQWLFGEDLQSFLMDESGDVRNRIRFVENLIRPMVEQYVGNAIRTDYTYKAISISENAINRREKELSRMKFFSRVAQEAPSFRQVIEQNMPVAETETEIEEIFQNMYVDEFENAITGLIRYISEKNDMEDKKIIVAKHLAVTGLGILKSFEQNNEHIIEVTDPLFYFWDRGAQRPDLKDAEFMGEYHNMSPTEIFERYQKISSNDRFAIEDYSQKESQEHRLVNGFLGPSRGRVPVYEVYWRDTEQQEYGYVKDDAGYEFFTKINAEDTKFKDKDLIKPKSEAHKKILGGKNKKVRVFVDVLRFCIFIPAEIIGSGQKTPNDVILDWGKVPFQESDTLDPSNVEFPYKVYAWGYTNGDVLSPIDDAIDPQRFLNRTLSVAESQVNNSRGSGTILDKDMIDPQDGEEGVLRDMNQSKPVFVNAKGNLNNSLGNYDNTIGNGTSVLFNIVSEMRNLIQNTTGVNEAMQGTIGGERKAVGVTQLQIQRGTLIQEPFYYALGKVLEQASQSMATVGKRIYSQSERKLPIIVGDKGAMNLMISEDMKLETFRVFINRTVDEEQQVQAGDQLLLTLLQANLVDQTTFADKFGRSTVDEVAGAMRQSQSERIRAERKAAEQQAEQQEQVVAAAEQQQQQGQASQFTQELREGEEKELDRQNDLDKIILKETLKQK